MFTGGIAISGWAMLFAGIIFGSMSMLGLLRVSDSDEYIGADVVKHGESAYPVNAWVEYQYTKTNKIRNMIGTQINIMGMNQSAPDIMNQESTEMKETGDNRGYKMDEK